MPRAERPAGNFHFDHVAPKENKVEIKLLRVHGVIMNDTFYVIWLDHKHNLYP